MEIRNPQTKADRIAYLIYMFKKINPDEVVNSTTLIKGTTIEKLGEWAGPGYKRIKDWCEKTISEKELDNAKAQFEEVITEPKKLEVKFSGKKEEYLGGATRDSSEGKGRYDLISPLFLRRLALVLEKGAKNHGDNNWKGGIKYSRLIDSSLRHISQYNSGMRDEDHIIQAVCNLMFLVHFEETNRTDLMDLNHAKN